MNGIKGSLLGLIIIAGAWGQTGEFMPPITNTQALTAHQVQGEYFGTISGGGNLGAWVIAMGNNAYNVSFLQGGLLDLPGQTSGGWNRTTRFNGSGTAASLTTTTGGYSASITGTGVNRVMTGTINGTTSFTLNKVQRRSPTQGMKPLAAWGTASSWFDSTTGQADLSKWTTRDNAPALRFGYLQRGPQTTAAIGSGLLHIEIRSAFCPTCRDQSRGNSGIYLRGMHEMQVLDSFGLNGATDELGSIYRVRAPLINAALPPLSFQTYDCYYTAGGGNTGTFTVYLNGVLVQNATPVTGITEAGFAGTTLYLQNHSNDVVYNNIWFIPNATTTSLPYQNILNTVVALDTKTFRISPLDSRSKMGLNEGVRFNILGRKINERKISAIPLLF